MRLNRQTAATICLTLALTAFQTVDMPAQAQNDSDTPSSFNITDPAQASDPIAKLELRIFDHTYKADSQEARIKRLENFVFGAAQTGDTQSRLNKLQESVTASSSGSSPAGQEGAPQKETEAAAAPKPTFDETDYPRVDQLERQILGQQHSHEILAGRLERLENKAFGRPSTSTDPADRVDALDAYVARHDIYGGQGAQNVGQTTPYTSSPVASAPYTSSPYTSSPYTSSPYTSSGTGSYPGTVPKSRGGYPGTPPASSSYPGSVSQTGTSTPYQSPYPTGTNSPYGQAASNPYLQANVTSTNDRLTAMEKTEFGRDYSTHSLKDRVQRLEKKVDPNKKGHEGQSLPARVDQLWAVVSVSNSIGNAPIASAGDSYSSSKNKQQNYGNHHSLLHSVGKVLGAAAVTAGSAGMMMGGMGMGGMGMGMGGMSRYGMGGYGMSPYSYGNYGSPSYGYGNYGGYGSGYGGYGSGLGRF